MNTPALITGIVFIVLGVLTYLYPVSEYGSFSDVHELCSSGFGQLGKAFSEEARENCQSVKYVVFGSYALMGVGAILVIIGGVKSSSGKSKPLSPQAKKSLAGAGIGIAVVIGGIFVYYETLQPDIQVSNFAASPSYSTKDVRVLDHGRVSTVGDYYYNPTQKGTYYLVFGNGFSFISTKYVGLAYTDGGKQYTTQFSIPPGIKQKIKVFADTGQTLSGRYQVEGGSGDDVNFSIIQERCTQVVRFSFTVSNYGQVDGNAQVVLKSDGRQVWSNNYFVEPRKEMDKSEQTSIQDCVKHSFSLEVLQQSRV